LRLAYRASVVDQKVCDLYPLFSSKQLLQVFFDLVGSCLFGEVQPPRQSLDVCIHNDSLRFPKGYSENDVRRFASDSRQLQKFFHCLGDFAFVLFYEEPARALNTFRLVAEEARGVDHGFQLTRVCFREVLCCPVTRKERGSDGVHHFVGALRGKYGRNEQLEGIRKVQRAFRIGVRGFKA